MDIKQSCSALLSVLDFHGLFRISELLDLQAADVIVHNEYLEILVKSTKTDQTGKATKSLLPRLEALPAPTLLFAAFLPLFCM